MEIVLITGMSGSGKSVALHALEDSGFYCVDNLPPELLMPFAELEQKRNEQRVAIAIDVRSANSLPLMPDQLMKLKSLGFKTSSIFLDASSDTLLRRYSETRRRHPLSGRSESADELALTESIEYEREILSLLREKSHVIDTSFLRAPQLQSYVKSLVNSSSAKMTLVFESFGFKRGIPIDADYVFDVRMLPNPHYENALRPLTGKDEPVQEFLEKYPDVKDMQAQIQAFMNHWLPALEKDHRNYITVAIGCTGGQHRSVYLVEKLSQYFSAQWLTLKRHRELDSK
jgi:UPF0042 nucleotide-binding protein